MKTYSTTRLVMTLFIVMMLAANSWAQAPTLSDPLNLETDVRIDPWLKWTGSSPNYLVEVSKVPNMDEDQTIHLEDYQLLYGPIAVGGITQNLSGVVYNPDTDTFFGVSNNPPELYEFNITGTLLRTIPFTPNFKDIEGITYIGEGKFAVISEQDAEILTFDLPAGSTLDVSSFTNVVIGDDNLNFGFEGISYDPVKEVFWVTQEKSPKLILEIKLSADFTTVVSSSQPFDAEAAALQADDLAGIVHLNGQSSVAYLGVSDHMLIVSEETRNLIEVKEDGTLVGVMSLNAGGANGTIDLNIPQPEGVCIDNEGRIVLVSEANFIYVFENPQIYAGNPPNLVFSKTVNVDSAKVFNGFLDGPETYYWRVTGLESNGDLEKSSVFQFTTEPISNDPGGMLVLTNPADNATLDDMIEYFTWDGEGSSYQLQMAEDFGFTSITLDTCVGPAYFRVSDEFIDNSKTYFWKVRGKNSNQADSLGSWSIIRQFSTPGLPTGATLLSPNNSDVGIALKSTFSWSGAESIYEIQISKDASFATVEIQTQVSDDSFTNNNLPLSDAERYHWRVRSWTVNGVSDWTSSREFYTVPIAPMLAAPADSTIKSVLTPILGWTGDGDTHEIEISTDTTFTSLVYSNSQTTQGLSVPASILSPGTQYYWRTRVVYSTIASPWSETWSIATGETAVVSALVAPTLNAPVTDLQPWFEWNGVADSYQIQVASDNSFGNIIWDFNSVADSAQMPSNLINYNMNYYWRVRASTILGTSNWSSAWTFSTLASPEVPILTAPADQSLDQSTIPLLTWTGIGEYYDVEVSDDPLFGSTIISDTSNSTQFQIAAGTLDSLNFYYWRIKAHNEAGISNWSATWKLGIGNVPTEPQLVAPNVGAVDQPLIFDFTWTGSADKYEFQLSTESNFSSFVHSDETTGTTLQIPANLLLIGSSYFWRVRGSNNIGYSNWSSSGSFSTGNVPRAPILMSPADSEEDVELAPEFVWTKTSTEYQFQMGQDSLFATWNHEVLSNDTTYQLPADILEAGSKYFWRVRAKNTIGFSNWTSPKKFFTGFVPVEPVLASPFNASTNINLDVTFQWENIAGTYNFQISESASFGADDEVWNKTVTLPQTKMDAVLKFSTEYYWRVRAVNEYGLGAWSTIWRLTTIGEPLAIEDPNNSLSGMLLYPNPATTQLQINLENSFRGNVQISVYNLQGKLMLMNDHLKRDELLEYDIEVGAMAKGIYWLQLNTGSEVWREKFVVK